ncbi:MAG: hypothetical protein ACXQTV_01940 [Candidatus Hecatellaceae archaeon]
MNKLKEELKQAAFKVGVDLFGVAPAERLENAPKGHRPSDLMGNVVSVISMGVGIGRGIRDAVLRAHSGLRQAIYSYILFGYQLLNSLLNQAAFRVARLLEAKGFKALPIPASPPFDPYQLMGAVSHRHAAVAAGLGELGWNSLLVTPTYGPRVRLVTVLTNAELEPDPMYSGKPLCDREACRSACVKACPVKAIHPEKSVSVKIGGKIFKHAEVDHWLCRLGSAGLLPGTLTLKPVKLEGKPGPEAYLKALAEASPWQRMETQENPTCGLCIMHCPVGE